jgi:hypothetical protein
MWIVVNTRVPKQSPRDQTGKCTGVLMFTMRSNINMVIFVDYQKQVIYGYCE